MSYDDLLRQTCDIYRKTTTIGSRGQTVVTRTAVETDVKCSIQIETITREEYELIVTGERSRTSFTGFFKYGTDILEGDEVEMTDTGDTRVFHVDKAPIVDTVGRSHHIEVDLEIL